MTTTKTKADIIRETVEYYGADPSRRSVIVDPEGGTTCVYNGPDGKRCAVARCCGDITGINEHLTSIEAIEQYGLPECRQSSDCKFWDGLQTLHDHKQHWTDKGLSQEGQAYVDDLLAKFGEDTNN